MFENLKKYFWNNLIAIDQRVNVLFGGDPDETISSRMGKAIERNECLVCRWICKLLDIIDPGHCNKSIEIDEGSNESF